MLNRRTLLQTLSLLPLAGALKAQETNLAFGTAFNFSYDILKKQALALSQKPYAPSPKPSPELVSKIDYDAHGKLKYKYDAAALADTAFPVTFQHVGQYFPFSVKMHQVEGEKAKEILYSQNLFTVPDGHVAKGLKQDPSAFAGLWLMEGKAGDWKKKEPWATWLGASYFRAVGELGQVGLSARGLALSPGQGPGPEEFPQFVSFYLKAAAREDEPVTIYALLDSPSVTGAYKFLCSRGKGVVMEIEKTLYLRKDVPNIAIAPLTSMYWYSETIKPTAIDWRPEVHDSDGLALFTGTGERIWRPLNNPTRTMTSSFVDNNPRGFGLLQRDREFLHYLDGVKYEKRPSAWVEPLGQWGKGAVQLVELPTDDEIHDNIVAAWVPEKAPKAGDVLTYKYKLHWLADEPTPTPLARVTATRLGRGGQPGQTRPQGVRKFLVEFNGGPLVSLPKGVLPQAVLTASRGTFGAYQYMEAVPNEIAGHWRVQFDLQVEGVEPVEMRCFLKLGETIASETWSYQYHP
jgi:periplasmic glucans biosynthesis protein